ncbi:glycosyl transferase family 2 [Alkalidesulfovibrio alkalitolerans DSM 16529]|uniref:Glycosyl transferase family 2 n=1 Tax=Alkalidesulfovibrio alkalitolerans DSM 16529 TaxID=1121439 RepID=S7UGS2_9BACT|nr:glycosyltransferase [Alkalidesulfovibrio alkalitolerans]EPR33029.1 glycosyl transferase family 2 [Alkalidesulfovibrio alkalitolerans DSM 16529]
MFRFVQPGLPTELSAISTDDVLRHLRNHLGNFLLDSPICAVYLNRLTEISGHESNETTVRWLRYLLRKYSLLNPFDEQTAQLMIQMGFDLHARQRALAKCQPPQAVAEWLARPREKQQPSARRARLIDALRATPFVPAIAERLLESDVETGVPAGGEWFSLLRMPALLRAPLERMRVRALLLQGDHAAAREAMEQAPDEPDNEYWLNTKAEIAARTGDTDRAAELYRTSLDLDPLQDPVRRRLAEIENPFRPDPATLDAKTEIFLYSWNKCDLLRGTLASLAASRIGGAGVAVLLNGCSDGSRNMVDQINREMFGGRIEIVELPINIGAPAARNWLLATERGRTADHVAFLDDDVEVPENWLESLLTALRDTPGAGVVGAKVLMPGLPRRAQYLYRNVAHASQGLLRLSLDSPHDNRDDGLYDFVRPTASVMGCCHAFTRAALDAVPEFDIRFTPSQMDDIAHDLDLRLKGFEVVYCGLVACVHHQMSGYGRGAKSSLGSQLGVQGNDVKFYYRFMERLGELARLNNAEEISALPPPLPGLERLPCPA